MHKLISKISFSCYFHRLIVLGIDVIFATISTLFSCLLTAYIYYHIGAKSVFLMCLLSLFASLISFFVFRTYINIIRFASMKDAGRILFAALLKSAVILFTIDLFDLLSKKAELIFFCLDFMLTTIVLIGIRYLMITSYDFILNINRKQKGRIRIFIYGVNEKSLSIINRFYHSNNYTISGFITFEKQYNQVRLNGYTVYTVTNEEEFLKITQRLNINGVLFASEKDAQAEQERLVVYCKSNDINAYIAPSVSELDKVSNRLGGIREIKIDDLLGRSEININLEEVTRTFKGKVILVTGAAGSIGSELCRQLASIGVGKLILFDSAETPMHNLRLELEKKYPNLEFFPIVGDIRILQRIEMVFRRYTPQFIFHAAAYKHVPLMEENPCEAVITNVIGTRYVADLAMAYGVEKMIMISTDKAVNPTNVMGASKRLAEIYVQSLGVAIENKSVGGNTQFITTRFGNVLGSNGSVIPRFKEQIEKMQPVTVTHPEITRYFMTIPEACRLVMEAATLGHGNEIFVFDMGSPVKIVDLAKQMIRLSGYTPDKDIAIEYTGLRPGEKLYEELLNNEENTLPTCNKKIRIAQVREYSYSAIENDLYLLGKTAFAADIENTVKQMKVLVPEFKSKNSPFEKFDKKTTETVYS